MFLVVPVLPLLVPACGDTGVCGVFPDLVVCVWGPKGFGLSALDLVESLLRWALCHFRALGAIAGAAL
ncbi:hypothetical protein Taro_027015 [Colocasia esculenta]|uniref:Secreted protein n=1 Tax=Colocasia esculenta TaxID=4460 RepID=A0A843VCW1_COLES|nr:hypothetical protein [Colocasia esculenta]